MERNKIGEKLERRRSLDTIVSTIEAIMEDNSQDEKAVLVRYAVSNMILTMSVALLNLANDYKDRGILSTKISNSASLEDLVTLITNVMEGAAEMDK